MVSTLVGGAVALVGSIVGILLSQRLQRKSARDVQILEAKVRILGECTEALYEYARVNFGRARARIQGQPETIREELRQEVYRCEARARSAIGQAGYLSGSDGLDDDFESAHTAVHASVRRRISATSSVAMN
ncbi:hypothetical protein EV651_12164 [Kribbella sp. VKM Ac-2571]|uniref:hypothetical protein n=1 Tax=Kribbella sp. VKM Ac-2571 TaxID=2512222 RepID=UPI001062106C|nr:hypothetical protein [Kribbella sp. VKM Ac-2571]TDO49661.1 hypothetical protein EV651_12164 [Kribbella sp. VKM Ac-2571]